MIGADAQYHFRHVGNAKPGSPCEPTMLYRRIEVRTRP
jgi:hypothetical protein